MARTSSLDVEIMALRFMVIVTNLGGVFTWEKFVKSKAWQLLKARLSTEEEQEFEAVCRENEGGGLDAPTEAFEVNPPYPEAPGEIA